MSNTTRNDSCKLLSNSYGFTVIEIITVVIILGILGAYISKTSLGIIDTANQQSEVNQLKAHLKYAQARAINSEGYWGIHFNTDTYALFQYISSESFHFFPGKEQDIATPTETDCEVNMPSGITYSNYIWFDSWGRAYANSTLTADTSDPITATLSVVSGIKIEVNTGYIHDS